MSPTEHPVVEHRTCRVCHSPDLVELFSLGDQYPSDFVNRGAQDGLLKVPITLDLCRGCTLVQQRFTAPGDLLYTRHYWYRSGVTTTMRDVLGDVVRCAVERVGGLRTGDVVLDIGSNDGTLLRHYDSHSPGGVVKIGVEPAENMRQYYREGDGVVLLNKFWNIFSETTVRESFGQARVVTACGMLYDLEDPNVFVANVARVLHPEGVFVAQLQCLRQTVELGDVGNFCHEHLEFYSLKSLVLLLGKNGLGVVDVEENRVNGGSYRVFCRHLVDGLEVSDRVTEALAEEDLRLRLHEVETCRELYSRMARTRDECVHFIREAVTAGKKVWVYGASTKGNVILQWYGLDAELITAAADRSPEKWGRYTIGTGIPIVPEYQFRDCRPDYALVLPYAFLSEFVGRERDWLNGGGKFLVPLPSFKVVS